MALATNSESTYVIVGQREDLSDKIWLISPKDTPVSSNAGKEMASAVKPEWETDVLRTAISTNQQLEGDVSFNADAYVPPVRTGNIMNIARRVASVTGTAARVRIAGQPSPMAYQMSKATIELKTDIEFQICGDGVAFTGNATAARTGAGLGTVTKTNWYDPGTGGSAAAPTLSNGLPTGAPVNSTNAAIFSETFLKVAIQKVFKSGGKIDDSYLVVGPFNKSQFSTFSGNATKTYYAKPGGQMQILGASDVYVSDFGALQVVTNLFMPEDRAYIIDPSKTKIAQLRPFTRDKLAKLGDADQESITTEYTLKVTAEASVGTIRHLTTT